MLWAFAPIGPPVPWGRTTCAALVALVCLWAFKLYSTWGAWGNLTVDSGHEMYIPALLAQGKTLYLDTWFTFGPASAYFNSYLFRIFGAHLNVLYWAGAMAALGSAVLLYLTGMRLSAWRVGWAAGAVLLLEAFQPTLFCFPLPYSFAAAYGCLVGCSFLWLATHITPSSGRGWIFAGGSIAALALLLKPEFGTASYAILTGLIALRGLTNRSWNSVAKDAAAMLPGVVACVLVILWMVSLAGVAFITHENIVSWPSTYFMQSYGKMWLESNGFILTVPAFADAFWRLSPLAALGLALYAPLWRRLGPPTLTRWSNWLRTGLVAAVVWVLVRQDAVQGPWLEGWEQALARIFFPKDMVLFVVLAAAAAWLSFLRLPVPLADRPLVAPVVLTYASLTAFRTLMHTLPGDYSIFYNGPVVLAFLWLVCRLLPGAAPRTQGWSPRIRAAAETLVCLACIALVGLYSARIEAPTKEFVPLITERGTVKAYPGKVRGYAAAIRFMKEKAAAGHSVLSLPEDTSLYFLAGTPCPVRVYAFTPGVISPGKMVRDTIAQIEAGPVRYLLWSNRTFPEYKVPVFGKDFSQDLGDHLRANYREVGPVIAPETDWEWSAVVWERKPGVAGP